MKLLKRIKDKGVLNSILILVNQIELRYFDLRHKTDTFRRINIDSLHISSENKKFAAKYDPSPISPLKEIFRTFRPTENDVFIDIGSGKGLTLLIASDFCFKKIIGIEFSSELVEIAVKNINKYVKRGNIYVVEIDASLYTFTDESYIFMFNPFSRSIMEKVMNNLIISYAQFPRSLILIYNNPVLEEFILSFNFFDSIVKKKIMGREFSILNKK